MKTLELDDLRRDPELFLQELEAGADFVVIDHDRRLAEVHSVKEGQTGNSAGPQSARPCGLAAGKVQIGDDFDDPLPDAILQDFGER